MLTSSIKEMATLIYTNSWEYKVIMFKVQDYGTLRNSYGFVVEAPDERLSDITYLRRSQIFKSKNAFDFLFDYEGDFDKTDIDGVKAAVMREINKVREVDFSTKYPIEQVYQELRAYVHENDGNGLVSISDGYCNIDTKEFDTIIGAYDFGYKRLEILRMFKLAGVLRTNKNRPYDWMLTDREGTPYRAYSFRDLLQESLTDEEGECA